MDVGKLLESNMGMEKLESYGDVPLTAMPLFGYWDGFVTPSGSPALMGQTGQTTTSSTSVDTMTTMPQVASPHPLTYTPTYTPSPTPLPPTIPTQTLPAQIPQLMLPPHTQPMASYHSPIHTPPPPIMTPTTQDYKPIGQDYKPIGQEYKPIGQEYKPIGQDYKSVGRRYSADGQVPPMLKRPTTSPAPRPYSRTLPLPAAPKPTAQEQRASLLRLLTNLNFNDITVSELKDHLRKLGQPATGKKATLVQRLQAEISKLKKRSRPEDDQEGRKRVCLGV